MVEYPNNKCSQEHKIMVLVRELTLLTLQYNIYFKNETRLPITLDHLNIFHLCLPPTSFDNTMQWAAMSIAFFGFLHIGEITCNSMFSENIHLTWDNIHFIPLHVPTSVSINIKASKTDPFRSGATIKIGSCSSDLCPVAVLHQYSQAMAKQTKTGPVLSIKLENICLVKDSLRKFSALLADCNQSSGN